MPTPAQPELEPGRVYRTKELARWGTNAPRLAKRLVREGVLVPLAHGLYVHPRRGRFGRVPPADTEVLRAFLEDTPFVITGPERWNALGLGTTALFSAPLVYNRKRSGEFVLGGRRYLLRRVGFPENPPPEWFVVDLFENAAQAGVSRDDLSRNLARAMKAGRFNARQLKEMARRYGTKRTQALIAAALGERTQ